MGLRSAAYICQRFTNSIAYMMQQKGCEIVNYLDDFAGVNTQLQAQLQFDLLGQLLLELGVEEASDKAVSPSQVIEFLGIEFDSVAWQLRITPNRLQEIKELVLQWEHKNSATKRQVQSLLGKLCFVCKCVRPGRLFLNRMLDWLRVMPDKHSARIPSEFKLDIKWWISFIDTFNGVSLIPSQSWARGDLGLAIKAGAGGCAAICNRQFWMTQPPPASLGRRWSMSELELLTLLASLRCWGRGLTATRITLLCQDTFTVAVINSFRTKNKVVAAIMRAVLTELVSYQMEIRAVLANRAAERVVDWLARSHNNDHSRSKFREWNQICNYVELRFHPNWFDF
jgi:hypothetical protein